jgi:non-heme chloroperoxidase
MKNKFILLMLAVIGASHLAVLGNDIVVPRLSVKQITLSNGVKLEYAEQGPANGTPVIFLHGYTDSWHSFQSVLPHLPPNIHAFAISQRGHGNSDRPLSGYAMKDFAGDVADFMKQLKISPAIIVGHSMGGLVAQQFVLDYPQLSKALVIVSSAAQFRASEAASGLAAVVNGFNNDPVDSSFVKEFQQSTITKPIDPVYFDTLVAESRKVPSHVWKAALNAIMSVDFTDRLATITQPVLIVWGDEDGICLLKDEETFLQHLPKARLLTYKGIGHALHWEDPARFAKDLLAFAQLHGLVK